MRIEHWLYTLPLRLKSIFLRRRVEKELDEELQFHLENKIEEGIVEGLTPVEARYRAMRAMHGLEQRKEEVRDTRGIHWLTDFVDDVRYAFRSLRRTPGFTAFVVVTLALGIGMTATPFSMLDGLVFRPYPVPEPGKVVALVSTTHDDGADAFSYREYLDIRKQTKSYEGVIASGLIHSVGFSARSGVAPQVRGAMLVSANYFDVLHVRPQIGRGFRQDEDEVPGRDAVVVIGPDAYKNDFSSDPSIVGRTIHLNGHDFAVVGVAPESFTGMLVFNRPSFYMPLAMTPLFVPGVATNFFEDRDNRELNLMARLNPEATLQQARSELEVMAQSFQHDYPKQNLNRGAAVHTQFEMRTQADSIYWKFGTIFTLLGVGVLLVACTNVAGLLLSRSRTRTREIAVRLAIGAGRFRLVRFLLTESVILSLLGGVGGVIVAYGGISFLTSLAIPSELPVRLPFVMDTRVLIGSFVIALLSSVICGLAPALQSVQSGLVNGLKSVDVDLPGRKRLWGRNALVVAQVSISLTLLTSSLLIARSFQHSVVATTSFAKDHLFMARFDPRLVQFNDDQTRQFYKVLAERARLLPGVQNAGLTMNPPLATTNDYETLAFVPDGFQMSRDRDHFNSVLDAVDEGYFDTMGIPIVRGRAFRTSDTADSTPVVIVNEQFAKHFWPDNDALGKHVRLKNSAATAVEIVGIAKTVKYRTTIEKPFDFAYMPLAQHPKARMVLMLRTTGDPVQMIDPVRDVVRGLAPNLPILEARTYEDLYRYNTVEGPGVGVKMVATMGAVALLLAVTGLYGVVSYNASRRTREIGIRIAIGASKADVLRLVIGKGLVLVIIGTASGLILGMALERFMNAMVFDTGGMDIIAYVIVLPATVVMTMLAAYIPARRASRIPPTQALRYE